MNDIYQDFYKAEKRALDARCALAGVRYTLENLLLYVPQTGKHFMHEHYMNMVRDDLKLINELLSDNPLLKDKEEEAEAA